jgi:receptor protein-tyrosine kinase/non-specific protein-tyrosine kinase
MTPTGGDGGIGRFGLPVGPGKEPKDGKLTAGVPLARLVRPRIVVDPELVVLGHPRGRVAERYFRLRDHLEARRPEPPGAIVITSASHGEGRSVVAANLALAYGDAFPGQVLLVGADLRRPSLGCRVEPGPRLGLSELLDGRTDPEHVILEPSNAPVHLLPPGAPSRDPLRLIVSDRYEQLMTELRRRYRILVLDTPPVVPYTDADLTARFADGVLIVARAGVTRRGPLARAIASVTAAPVLGTLLNDADPRAAS